MLDCPFDQTGLGTQAIARFWFDSSLALKPHCHVWQYGHHCKRAGDLSCLVSPHTVSEDDQAIVAIRNRAVLIMWSFTANIGDINDFAGHGHIGSPIIFYMFIKRLY